MDKDQPWFLTKSIALALVWMLGAGAITWGLCWLGDRILGFPWLGLVFWVVAALVLAVLVDMREQRRKAGGS
jgi:Flp pilus assembly protein TadB